MQEILCCHVWATFVIFSDLFWTLYNVGQLSCTVDTVVLRPVFGKQAGKCFVLNMSFLQTRPSSSKKNSAH